VIASAARVETVKAQLASADELDRQTANQVANEVAPKIDSIRAQVERQSTEQRVTTCSAVPACVFRHLGTFCAFRLQMRPVGRIVSRNIFGEYTENRLGPRMTSE
jgi:hypothetical protein